MEDMPAPGEGFVITQFLVSRDVARSTEFYTTVLGGKIVMEGGYGSPAIVKLANTWIIINEGGGPTDDKPDVTLEVRADPNKVDMFMNFRVADIQACYAAWTRKGAQFLTEPKEREREWRCYMKDPDGYIIEVGQFKM
jgi:catechol 2,3-dioxygenase-like lactoylglutathione lyase family enzyme